MKKIALILALMILGTMAVSAKIGHGTDDFDGSKWTTSGTSLDSGGKWIGFQRKTNDIEKEYYISFSLKTFNYIKFSKDAAEIKIDNLPVQKLMVKDASSMPSPLEAKMSFIDVRVVVPIELVQQIGSAQRIAIRIFKENSVPEVYVLPDAVLAEWKQVIATEK